MGKNYSKHANPFTRSSVGFEANVHLHPYICVLKLYRLVGPSVGENVSRHAYTERPSPSEMCGFFNKEIYKKYIKYIRENKQTVCFLYIYLWTPTFRRRSQGQAQPENARAIIKPRHRAVIFITVPKSISAVTSAISEMTLSPRSAVIFTGSSLLI